MELSKKENEIKVLAKYLRRSIENITDLKQAVNELFKGEAELSLDNDEQFVIYTGQTWSWSNNIKILMGQVIHLSLFQLTKG